MLDREPLSDGRTRLTFSLPLQEPPGEVSVVGSFNDWRAGRHTLAPSPEGMRRVSVIVEPGDHHFRYLATGDRWGDEPDADVVNEHGSMVHCPPLEPSEPAPANGAGEAHGAAVRPGNGNGSRATARGAATPAAPKTQRSTTARPTGKAKRAPVAAAAKTGATSTATAPAAKPSPSESGRSAPASAEKAATKASAGGRTARSDRSRKRSG